MKINKRKEGITLISLVITIIILLILAGITIMALTGEDGLINKITIARKEQIESETEEKLKLKIMKLKTDIINNEQRQATLDDLENLLNSNSNYYDSEIISITDNEENNKLLEMDGYIFEIDEKLSVINQNESNKVSVTDATYEIEQINGENIQVRIKITNNIGIAKVITPSGNEITPKIKKKEVAIDYVVISGNDYNFKIEIEGSEEIEEYTLKANKEAKIKVIEINTNAYPTLTENGIETTKKIEIDYGKNTDNYYSIDEGKTWNKYEGKITIKKETTVIAKSIIKNEISPITKSDILLNLAKDALSNKAYDNSQSTSTDLGNGESKKMLVDSSMWGRSIYISGKENALAGTGKYSCCVVAYLADGTSSIIYNSNKQNAGYTRKEVKILQNTEYIVFITGSHETIRWYIKEVEVQ